MQTVKCEAAETEANRRLSVIELKSFPFASSVFSPDEIVMLKYSKAKLKIELKQSSTKSGIDITQCNKFKISSDSQADACRFHILLGMKFDSSEVFHVLLFMLQFNKFKKLDTSKKADEMSITFAKKNKGKHLIDADVLLDLFMQLYRSSYNSCSQSMLQPLSLMSWQWFLQEMPHERNAHLYHVPYHVFRVNLIMDTLGALALATKPPKNQLMDRHPVGHRKKLSLLPASKLICNSILDFNTLRLIIPKDILVKWDDVLCESLIPESDKFYRPFPNNSALLIKFKKLDTSKKADEMSITFAKKNKGKHLIDADVLLDLFMQLYRSSYNSCSQSMLQPLSSMSWLWFLQEMPHERNAHLYHVPYHVFRVNLIMDTLGALALATEPPKNQLMDRHPVGRSSNLVPFLSIHGASCHKYNVEKLVDPGYISSDCSACANVSQLRNADEPSKGQVHSMRLAHSEIYPLSKWTEVAFEHRTLEEGIPQFLEFTEKSDYIRTIVDKFWQGGALGSGATMMNKVGEESLKPTSTVPEFRSNQVMAIVFSIKNWITNGPVAGLIAGYTKGRRSGYHQKDKKPSQNDKTEHGMEKTVQNQGQSPKMTKSESILKNTVGCNLNPSDGPGKPNSISMKTVKTLKAQS
ncbi:probable E3 ubiquitin-protein ligase RNF217 [Tanacetum coccineum]